jgi:glycine cleavage system T protein
LNLVCLISRTGYTGEDGFEIMATNEDIKTIFEALLNMDEVLPCGLGARDTLRFEAAMPLYGHELSSEINPVEAGLKYFIKQERPFIGRDSLVAYEQNEQQRKIIGLELLDKGIAREGYEVQSEAGEVIGRITTGYKSPTLDRVIAMAIIDKNYSKLGTIIYVNIRDKLIKAKVVSKKFLKQR